MNPIYPNVQQQQQQQQQQSYPYQQPPPMTNVESQPINAAPRRQCRCNLRKKIFENPRKKQLITLFFTLISSALLCAFATHVYLIFSIIPKAVGFLLGFFSLKERRQVQLLYGIHVGFTMFSMLYTIALAFRSIFTLFFAFLVLLGEVMTIIYSSRLANEAQKNNQSTLDVSSEDESDLVAASSHQEQAPAQEPVYQPQQPVFQEVYPSQPVAPQPQPVYQPQIQYPQQHFQQPAPVSQPMHSDEALFQKYSVQLSLLSEMSFANNYQQKVRNARLLEKHNGNIQAVVAEIVQSGQ